jgi:hypothetical protein
MFYPEILRPGRHEAHKSPPIKTILPTAKSEAFSGEVREVQQTGTPNP